MGDQYDIENRLIHPGGPNSTYAYAPGNKRVWRNITGTATDEFTFWGVDGQQLATYELRTQLGSTAFVLTSSNVYFGGALVAKTAGSPGVLTPVAADRLGSIGSYYPYGGDRSGPPNGTEKFATYFRDTEGGLDYAQRRYHQPGNGRFLPPDPYQSSGGLQIRGVGIVTPTSRVTRSTITVGPEW